MKKILISVLLIAVAIGGVFVYQVLAADNSDTIYQGVSVEGVDVGGMTIDEAAKAVENYCSDLQKTEVTLKAKSEKVTVSLEDLGIQLDSKKVAKDAYNLGRSGNVIKRYKDKKDLESNKKDISVDKQIDESKFQDVIEENESELVTVATNASLSRENGSFVVTEGKNGQDVPIESNVTALNEYLTTKWNGDDFDFELEVEESEPEYTTEDLQKVKDVLGTYSTNYSSSAYGRAGNVANGAEKINGTMVYPGETFSTYEHVEPFTAENGYAMAGAYASGEVVESMGGGICQVATTLYNAIIRAELEVTERYNHQMVVSYVPISADAAISGTVQDFKFKNTLDTPVYIEGSTYNRNITFTIYGEETRDSNRTIEFESETTSTTQPGKPIKTKDKTLEKGETKVTQPAHVGYTGVLWKIVYENGVQVEKIKMNSSRYNPSPERITVGTKKVKDKDKDEDAEEGEESDEDIADEEATTQEAVTTETPVVTDPVTTEAVVQ